MPSSTPKLWKNKKAGGTKINAAALIDLEERLTGLIVNAKWFGVKGNGTTDDTATLQAAIDSAIANHLPLYLPPGEYKITSALEAENKFMMFGSGEASEIIKSASTFDGLIVGPGEEGSGVGPGGYLRDFKITGGNETITTAGISKGKGTAALKLNGIRMMEVTNVEIRGNHDIGLDLVNNCWGSTFKNCRLGFESCRVGINIRSGPETGEDITFFDCWVSGEVAAVFMEVGQGYRFIGGQYSANRQGTVNEDEKGVFICGKNYLTGAEGGDCDFQLWTSFEYFRRCWAIRAYRRIFLWSRSNFNQGAAGQPALGFYKSSSHTTSQILLFETNLHDDYSGATDEGMVVREGSNSSSVWVEMGTHGNFTTKDGEKNGIWDTLGKMAKVPRRFGVREGVTDLPGVELKVEGGALKASLDGGGTWKTVKLE